MAKAINRWVLLALLSSAFGCAGIFTGWIGARTQVTDAQKQRWRNYASAVQRGERSASPEAVQALTDLAISNAETEATLLELITWLGIGTLSIGLLLARHLGRSDLARPTTALGATPAGLPEQNA